MEINADRFLSANMPSRPLRACLHLCSDDACAFASILMLSGPLLAPLLDLYK